MGKFLKMSNIRFALIGCGKIAIKHAVAIAQINGAELCCVSDPDEIRAKQLAGQYKIPWYTDYHEMFKKEEIDVVNILTPSGLHAKHTIDCAKYKKHIVVEKPMALTIEDAGEMINACEKAGRKLFILKQYRYNIPVKRLKETVDSGRFGKLVLGTIRVRWCRKQEYYDHDLWRGTKMMDGGIFLNQAAHHIDLLIWLMGEVETVFAKTSTSLVNIETEDTGAVILKFKNGGMGIIEATTATRPKDLEGSISILGEYGSVELTGFAADTIKVWAFQEPLPEDKLILDKYSCNPEDNRLFAHKEYLNGVVESIKNNKKVMVDGNQGLKFVELIHAIYVSAETGKEIYINEKSCFN